IVEPREVLDLFARLFRDEPRDEQAGIVVPVRGVEPESVAKDGTAEIRTEVVISRELVVAGIEALTAQLRCDVAALERAILPGRQIHPAQFVAAGLDHETQRDAGTLRFGAFRRSGNLDLFVGVVVAKELIPDDAVELDQLLPAASVVSRAGRRRSADRVAAHIELRRRQAGHEPREAANAAAVR